jgi:hypothetical protein
MSGERAGFDIKVILIGNYTLFYLGTNKILA